MLKIIAFVFVIQIVFSVSIPWKNRSENGFTLNELVKKYSTKNRKIVNDDVTMKNNYHQQYMNKLLRKLYKKLHKSTTRNQIELTTPLPTITTTQKVKTTTTRKPKIVTIPYIDFKILEEQLDKLLKQNGGQNDHTNNNNNHNNYNDGGQYSTTVDDTVEANKEVLSFKDLENVLDLMMNNQKKKGTVQKEVQSRQSQNEARSSQSQKEVQSSQTQKEKRHDEEKDIKSIKDTVVFKNTENKNDEFSTDYKDLTDKELSDKKKVLQETTNNDNENKKIKKSSKTFKDLEKELDRLIQREKNEKKKVEVANVLPYRITPIESGRNVGTVDFETLNRELERLLKQFHTGG